MNKVITINLGGTSFQLEEVGYDALRAYLDHAGANLRGNPDRDEIISDIEQAIGEKFRAQLNGYKNVILAKEVEAVLAQMGPIQDDSNAASASAGAGPGNTASDSAAPGAAAAASASAGPGTAPKRLYRVHEGAMIAGVCNGLAAYFGIDPTIVRLAFVAMTLLWGTGILVYLAMAIVVPSAHTPEEMAAASGSGLPPTAQDFIRRAKQGYYGAMKGFPDRQARRQWKRKFKQDMREWKASFHREVASNVQECRRNWGNYWGIPTCPPANPAAGAALPFVSLVHGLLVIGWICAVFSLLATGAVFGIALPVGLPVWAAVLILLVIYGMLVWPLKAARRAFYYSSGQGGGLWPLVFLLDAVIWIAVVSVLLWIAFHQFPQAREAIHNIPAVAHDMADTFRDWWHRQ